jgi:hypothetical protein
LPRPRLGRRLLRHFDHVGQRYRIHNAKASAEAAGVSLPASCAWTASHQKRRTQHYRFKDSEHMTPFRPFLGLVRVDSARIFDNIFADRTDYSMLRDDRRALGTASTTCGSSRRLWKATASPAPQPGLVFLRASRAKREEAGSAASLRCEISTFRATSLVSPPLPICPGRTLE